VKIQKIKISRNFLNSGKKKKPNINKKSRKEINKLRIALPEF